MANSRYSTFVFNFDFGLPSGFGAHEALFLSKLSQADFAIINLTFLSTYAIFSPRD
jgi:hypothetical protein